MTQGRLIVLPCHSIWKGGESKGLNKDEWFLAPFQIEGQDHLCFREHVEMCFRELAASPNSLLVISGGQTKEPAGPVSEAYSYYTLAKALYGSKTHEYHDLFRRVALEEYARDSFENVLFSICRYKQFKGDYPSDISIVGFQFKAERIVEQHLIKALKFPRSNIRYLGNAPKLLPNVDQKRYFEDLYNSESKHAIEPFKADNYGRKDPLLSKRNSRNPFHREHGYEKENPDLEHFMSLIVTSSDHDEALRSSINLPWT